MPPDLSSAIKDDQGRGKVGDFLKDKSQAGSKLFTAYCPLCMVVTNLSVSIVPGIVTERDGSARIVASRMYHCEVCRSFVRSEEDEISALGDFLCHGH